MLYAVCIRCPFLRAFSQRVAPEPGLNECPACSGELVMQRNAARFQPTYVGRVSLDLHAIPPLVRGDRPAPTAGETHAVGSLPNV